MRTIQVDRKEFIKTLSKVKEDNISIADVSINRKNLIEALKLQTQDGSEMLTLTYGKVSWKGKKESKYDTSEVIIDKEPCIQFNCNHTTMRFLNRPKTVSRYSDLPAETIPLNFSLNNRELTGIPINTVNLLSAINRVSHCMATDNTRGVLHAILFDLTQDNFKVVAADGFRLGVSEFECHGLPESKILIDKPDIERLVKFLRAIQPNGKGKSKTYPDVYFTDNDKSVTFQANHGKIELAKKDGTFPNYQQLIPTTGTHIEFIASDMLRACKALSKTANDGSGIVRLYFKAGYPVGKITLKAKDGYNELSDMESELDAKVERDCQIAVNINYLMHYLKTCKDNPIDLFITSHSSPLVFMDTEANCEVVMPMIVNWEK